MKILYITPGLQHPRLRGATRHYHFVKELSKRHEITLLSLVRSAADPEAIAEIRKYTTELYMFNVNGESYSPAADLLGKLPVVGRNLEKNLKIHDGICDMRRAFERLVKTENFDLVIFHGKSVFPVIEHWSGLPIVTDFCDATSLRIGTSMRYRGLLRAPFYFGKMVKMRRLERRLIEKSSEVAFISNRDRAAVLGPEDRSPLLPLGVDHESWQRRNGVKRRRDIVFTGVMDYAPNHDAAMRLIRRILPGLRQRLQKFSLRIVGRDPLPELIKAAKPHPEVEVTGFVEDVRPYLERARLFVAPLRYASGTQNKVLEAMSMEVPVITNRMVVAGLQLDNIPEPPVMLAERDHEFVDAIVALFDDAAKRKRLAEESRRFVITHFDWTASAAKLEAICERALAG